MDSFTVDSAYFLAARNVTAIVGHCNCQIRAGDALASTDGRLSLTVVGIELVPGIREATTALVLGDHVASLPLGQTLVVVRPEVLDEP